MKYTFAQLAFFLGVSEKTEAIMLNRHHHHSNQDKLYSLMQDDEQYDHWTSWNHQFQNETQWVADKPTAYSVEGNTANTGAAADVSAYEKSIP